MDTNTNGFGLFKDSMGSTNENLNYSNGVGPGGSKFRKPTVADQLVKITWSSPSVTKVPGKLEAGKEPLSAFTEVDVNPSDTKASAGFGRYVPPRRTAATLPPIQNSGNQFFQSQAYRRRQYMP